MADDQSSSSGRGGPRKPARRGKRKPVTIDLTATEVTGDESAGAKTSKAGKTTGATSRSTRAKSTPAKPSAPKTAAAKTGTVKTNAQLSAENGKADAAPKPDATAEGSADANAESAAKAAGAEATKSASAATKPGSPAPKRPEGSEDAAAKTPESSESNTSGTPSESAGPAEDHGSGAPASGSATTKPVPDTGPAAAAIGDQISKEGPPGDEPPHGKPADDKTTKRGAGFFGLLAASLIGALVVSGALIGLLFSGYLPVGSKADLDALTDALDDARNEISILETRLDEAEEVTAENARSLTDAGTVHDRLASAEEILASLRSATQAAGTALRSIRANVDGLQQDGASANEAAGAIEARQKSMAARLNSLEESTGNDIRNLSELARNFVQASERLDRMEALQSDLLDLRKLVETGAAGSDVALASQEEAVAGLRDRVDALARASSTAVIDARLAALEAASGGVDVIARRLGALEAEVDTTITRVDQAVKSFSPEAPQIETAITAAFANLEPRFTVLSADINAASATINQLRKQAMEMRTGLDENEQGMADAMTGIGEKIGEISNEIGNAVGALDSDLADLASKVATLETEVNKPGALDQAALALAVTRLKAAIDGGRPFEVEFSAVKALLGDEVDLTALEERAASGLAEKNTLIAAYPITADAIRQALGATDKPTDDSGDPVDKVLTGLRSLVRIKSLEKNNPNMLALAAMSEAVKEGDLKAALTAWESLPDAAKAVSSAWAGNVKARLSVDEIVEKVTANVISSVSNSEGSETSGSETPEAGGSGDETPAKTTN